MRPRENRERRGRTAACFALSGNAIANAIPTAMTTSATHRTHFRAAAIGMAPREGAYLRVRKGRWAGATRITRRS